MTTRNASRPASRPSLDRVHTRKSTEQADAILDQGIKLTIDGKDYAVRAGDLTAIDTRELRRQTGYSFNGLLEAFGRDPDLDLIAGIMWLSLRIDGDKEITYDDVAEDLGYGALVDMKVNDAGPEELEGDILPEGSAGDS